MLLFCCTTLCVCVCVYVCLTGVCAEDPVGGAAEGAVGGAAPGGLCALGSAAGEAAEPHPQDAETRAGPDQRPAGPGPEAAVSGSPSALFTIHHLVP